MKKYISKYLNTWWIPLTTYTGFQIIYIIGLLNGSRIIFKLFPYFLIPIAISIGISSLSILVKRKWYVAIGQAIGGLIIVLFFYVFFFPRDLFFSHLDIPDNLEYKTPIELINKNSVDSLMSLSFENDEFILANYGQGGMYKTFIWLDPKEDGRIYLKAFEEKGNIPLSTDRLRDQSEIKVLKGKSECYTQEFTIYEGVWGNYYVGRIEVWFNPINGQDYKLTEKLFRIEGWIR